MAVGSTLSYPPSSWFLDPEGATLYVNLTDSVTPANVSLIGNQIIFTPDFSLSTRTITVHFTLSDGENIVL